jgi:6-phosphogluconolactonase (cycloisomerase 2 family)
LKPSRFFAAIALPAAFALAGCSGSSNNRSVSTPSTPSTFPAEIAYVGNVPSQDVGVRSSHITADNSVPSVQTYRIAGGGSTSSPVTISLLSQSDTNSDGTPEALALDSTHRYLFVVVNDDNQYLEAFQINGNGSLNTTPSASVVLTYNPAHNNAEIGVAAPTGVPSNTEYVYIATGSTGQLNAYSFNTSTATLTAFTPGVSSNDVPYSLATDAAGAHLYSGGGINHPVITPYVIDTANGTLTAEGTQQSGNSGPVLVVNNPAASAVYSYDTNARYLYQYSTAGGTLTSNGQTPAGAGNDLAIAPNGSALYLSNGTNGTITSSVISSGSLGTAITSPAVSDTDLVGVAVDATSSYVLTLDEYSDSLVAYPITSPGSLGTPIGTALGGSEPVSALFVPVARPV